MGTGNDSVAVVIPADGPTTTCEWSEETLAPAYTAIPCRTVEMLTLHAHGVHMWFDDEAWFLAAPPPANPRASSLARREILGTVLLTPVTDRGDVPGFSPEKAEQVRAALPSGVE